jgi:purine-nucleoside/S-methyl-5'-thioadenosine phosphorylase / adenosine deaminase
VKENLIGIKFLAANWHAPSHINAGISLRYGGVSTPPYDQLNLGIHVKDVRANVSRNRECLAQHLKLPTEPVWLNQVHGNNIIQIDSPVTSENTDIIADGSYSTEAKKVCVVMTADCLPLLLCDDEGTQIAAVHIGWRGFTQNIVTAAVDKFTCPPDKLIAWLGPCVCDKHYETGAEVRNACLSVFGEAEEAFTSTRPGYWQTDLHKLVTLYLNKQGVKKIYVEQRCTYHESESFFSYRRNKKTGRMASLIWMDSQSNID